MTGKAVAKFLIEHGKCTDSGGVLALPGDTRATLFVSMGAEPLVVEGLASVAVSDDAVVARTVRGDTFVVLAQDVRALRFEGQKGRAGVV